MIFDDKQINKFARDGERKIQGFRRTLIKLDLSDNTYNGIKIYLLAERMAKMEAFKYRTYLHDKRTKKRSSV